MWFPRTVSGSAPIQTATGSPRCSAGLVVCALALLLGACGGGSDSENAVTPTVPQTQLSSDSNHLEQTDNTVNSDVDTPGSDQSSGQEIDEQNSDADSPAGDQTPEQNDEVASQNPEQPPEQDNETSEPASTTDPITDPVTETDPVTNTPPATETPPPTVELSPIALLFEEIRLMAGAGVIQISDKLAGGIQLESNEEICLGSYDPAVGETLTELRCDERMLVGNSILQLQSASFNPTMECGQSISVAQLHDCQLQFAEMVIPIQWVVPAEAPKLLQAEASATASDNQATNAWQESQFRIANISPIAGIKFDFDRLERDQLTLTSTSNITGSFDCVIEISTAGLLSSQSSGNCQREIATAINRLFEIRSAFDHVDLSGH